MLFLCSLYLPGLWGRGAVAVAVRVRGKRRGKSWLFGVGGGKRMEGWMSVWTRDLWEIGDFGGWMDIHRSASLL